MTVIKTQTIIGQYMHPIIDSQIENSDPWQRNYFQPPPLKRLTPRSYPIVDIRSEVFQSNYSPELLLNKYGFGVVKHHSTFLDQLNQGAIEKQALIEIYQNEVQDLVKKVTGAKTTFVTASVFRQGKRAPTTFKIPTSIGPVNATPQNAEQADGGDQSKVVEVTQREKLVGQDGLMMAAPVRIPHMDYTPLGIRQAIRREAQDIHNAAIDSGVIRAEDKICRANSVDPTTVGSDFAITENYNKEGELGPRYAAFSIWRPLYKVTRDPITLAPRKGDSRSLNRELVYWPYSNKIPGPQELGGDYLKEYAMLGVNGSEAVRNGDTDAYHLTWYYLSGQTPDEVLLIKLFDSASLGMHGHYATAPWHASPELGDLVNDQQRESIDIRIIAFW